MRAQDPFAVAQAVAREHGVHEAMVVVYRRWPASVGRRTYVRTPCHAPTSARVTRKAGAKPKRPRWSESAQSA